MTKKLLAPAQPPRPLDRSVIEDAVERALCEIAEYEACGEEIPDSEQVKTITDAVMVALED